MKWVRIVGFDFPRRLNYPAKVFEYLAAGHPILAVAPDGEGAALIRQQRAGIVARPDDRAGIVAVIRGLLRRHRAGER